MTTSLHIQIAKDLEFNQTIENNAKEYHDGTIRIINKDSKIFEQLKNVKRIELVQLNEVIINSLTNIVKLVQKNNLNLQNTNI